MPTEKLNLLLGIILISITFFIICVGLVILVSLYNRRSKLHLQEKNLMNQNFESELLKTHLEVQEQTMQTIATDLHDNIGQLLSLTTLTLNSVNLNDVKRSEEKIATSLSLVNKSIKELRDLAKILQGEQLLETGLGNALQQELDRLERIGGYELKVNNQLIDSATSSPKKDLIILRLLQEIINNIIKHAEATCIEIDVHLKGEHLFLSVTENGVGFDYEQVKKQNRGIGLYSIHKRIEMITGNIQISPRNPNGTIIAIEIPYP